MTDKATSSTKRIISPTIWYLLIALAVSGIAWWWSFSLFTTLHQGIFWSGELFAWIHLAILGSLLTGAFGVMFQLIPIAFQAPPLSKKVAVWHLPAHLLSITFMVYGFAHMQFDVVGTGGSLLLVSVFSYMLQVYKSYKQAHNKTIVHRRLWLPILGLMLVMCIGIWQAFDGPGTGISLLFSHIILGVLWFWGGLVLVISYKFTPMFVLSHGYNANLKLSSGLYFAGVALFAISVYWPVAISPLPALLGAVFTIGGLSVFSLDILRILRARKRKRIVFPLQITITATFTLIISIILLIVAVLVHSITLSMEAGYLFYFAGMVPLLTGYAQKIIPFLYYEYRYSHASDRKNAPLIDEMVPSLPIRAAMALYAVSVVAGLVYFIAFNQFSPSVQHLISLALSLLGSLAFIVVIISLIYVLRIGGKRPVELPEK